MAGNYKHGLRHKRIYNIWRTMRQRCSNPKCINYKNYGGKGISVCSELGDASKFADWAYSNGYSENMTIDRIDVNGNYTPDNCRWVTQKIQQNNRSNNRIIECRGEKHTLSEWAEITHISSHTIHARIKKLGWSVEKSLFTPVGAIDTKFKKKPFN